MADTPAAAALEEIRERADKRLPDPLVPGGFPFPLAEPRPAPMMVTRPCGCTSMTVDEQPVQISWCEDHDPGYEPS